MGIRLRQKLYVDRKVQGALVTRVLAHWIVLVTGMFILLAGFPLLAFWLVRAPGSPTTGEVMLQTWRAFWPAIFASALMLPLLILDMIRVSNRFAGPLVRLRRAMRDLAEGKPVPTIKFREGDFWFDLAEDFNVAAARINECAPATPARSNAKSITQTVVDEKVVAV